MNKANTKDMAELSWSSPKGKFAGAGKQVSEAPGRKPFSTDLKERHPFDIEILRVPPGKISLRLSFPQHAVGVLSRDLRQRQRPAQGWATPIETGDAFTFPPDEPHQLINDGAEDLVLYVVADNPIGESSYFPDSKKWLVRSPERGIIRSENLNYFDGEE